MNQQRFASIAAQGLVKFGLVSVLTRLVSTNLPIEALMYLPTKGTYLLYVWNFDLVDRFDIGQSGGQARIGIDYHLSSRIFVFYLGGLPLERRSWSGSTEFEVLQRWMGAV